MCILDTIVLNIGIETGEIMTKVDLVATDLDGTFLSDTKRINEDFFDQILKRLEATNGHFVIASGRDEEQIHKQFKPFVGRYDVVADNGAVVRTAKGELLNVSGLSVAEVETMMQVVADLPFDPRQGALFTGHEAVYMLRDQGRLNLAHQSLVLMMFSNVKMIDSLDEIHEPILKVTITYAEHQMMDFIAAARDALEDRAHVTTSGYGSVDIVAPDVNKANGLAYVAKHYGLNLEQDLVAFGDGLNDAEMLAKAKRPFAMPNGDKTLIATYPVADADNNHDGVLTTLENLLNK